MSTELGSVGDIDILQFSGGDERGILLQLASSEGNIIVNPIEAFMLARALLNWVDALSVEEERKWD